MPRIPSFALGFVMILLGLFLYINASILFGEYTEIVRITLTYYLVLYSVVLATVGRGLPDLNVNFFALRNFAIMFIITVLVMTPLAMFIAPAGQVAEVTVVLATGFGALHFIKAYIEEVVWRVIRINLGINYSLITFGIFHLSVSFAFGAFNLISIGVLMGLRYIWDIIAERFTVFGSTGSHFGYNAVIQGLRVF